MKGRTIRIPVPALLLSIHPLQILGGEAEAKADATVAAESWFALADAGDYGTSWDETASMFRGQVARNDRVQVLK